eukprot:TRINITY_DN25768_c0_g1_i3.p1 TRINITY_DN25768_c0_g1~~TRINITY_DN25768_c0_g1_i3.p1  ORF type:complete len:141 (+),score=22.93 TRINITY_DN25768_c0_g1_i3:182-604(+)
MGCGASAQPVADATVQRTLQQVEYMVNVAIHAALKSCILYACDTARVEGGFSNNPRIRFGLPRELEKFGSTCSGIGLSSQVDDFVVLLNRAAETAVPACKTVLMGAADRLHIASARALYESKDPNTGFTGMSSRGNAGSR